LSHHSSPTKSDAVCTITPAQGMNTDKPTGKATVMAVPQAPSDIANPAILRLSARSFSPVSHHGQQVIAAMAGETLRLAARFAFTLTLINTSM
jgi:hypothetical protein